MCGIFKPFYLYSYAIFHVRLTCHFNLWGLFEIYQPLEIPTPCLTTPVLTEIINTSIEEDRIKFGAIFIQRDTAIMSAKMIHQLSVQIPITCS